MNKRSIKNALAASLSAEETSFKSRLAKAEAAFGQPDNPVEENARARVIRDSFTMPEKDYALINAIKSRCLDRNLTLNKSEVLRAGLQALCEMPDDQLATLVANMERVKTGRPSQN